MFRFRPLPVPPRPVPRDGIVPPIGSMLFAVPRDGIVPPIASLLLEEELYFEIVFAHGSYIF